MLSADTYMDEMLLVATKRTHGYSDENPSITCINLSEIPRSVAEAYWYAKWIKSIKQSEVNNGLIHEAGKRIGSWTTVNPISRGFPWFPVGMQNHYLASVAGELMKGYLYSAEDRQSWGINLSMMSLGQLVDVGPTHDLIGHPRDGDGRGAFTFDRITPDMHPMYPALWSADSSNQQRLLVSPTHGGEPATNDEDSLQQMLDHRSDLFISRTLRMTSQSLAAARTQAFAMGGRAWTTLQTDDDALKCALAIWLNSTFGLILRTCYAQTTQPGRATMGVGAIAGFPVPNFADQSPAGEHARITAQSRHTELLALDLQPISYAFRDLGRHRIDHAVLEMVGLGENQQAVAATDALRNQWCREPAVHGGNNAIMKALGLT